MSKYLLTAVMVLVGAGIPVQVAANSRLKDAVGSPALACLCAFVIGASALGLLSASGVLGRGDLSAAAAGGVPWWAWTGGLLSAAAVLASILALKAEGAEGVVAFTVLGQLVAAMAIDHFGWLGVKQSPINAYKVAGAVLLVAGAALMSKK